jgi:phosphomannomutase/phosphoglucomutase
VHADLGVAHDSDADRCIFVDEQGNVVWGDKTGAVFVEYLVERDRAKTVVTPISSSSVLEDVVKRHGANLVWTKVGSTIVTNKMLEIDAEIGVEDNGGLFYSRYQPDRDGALAAMMMELLAERGNRCPS